MRLNKMGHTKSPCTSGCSSQNELR
jgi:hypothetical protein